MDRLPVPATGAELPYLKERPRKSHALSRFLLLLLAVSMVVILALCLNKLLPGGLLALLGTKKRSSSETTVETTTENLYAAPEEVPSGAYAVLPCDLSARAQGILVENPTEKAIPEESAALSTVGGDAVRVLVLTTHPYETYAEDDWYTYADGASFSGGSEENTVYAVAAALTKTLTDAGIRAVLLSLDTVSGVGSYAKAEAAIRQALTEYPDVSYIFDLHRAVLLDETGAMLRPVTQGEDGVLAQMRLVVGTGYDGWQSEYAAASALFEAIGASEPSLFMPIRLSESRLLQHLSPTVFTIEVGSTGNHIGEACRAARRFGALFAEAVAEGE